MTGDIMKTKTRKIRVSRTKSKYETLDLDTGKVVFWVWIESSGFWGN